MTNTEARTFASELGEMIIIEMADFVQLFSETFEIAAGTTRSDVPDTCPRWHQLREMPFVSKPYEALAAVRDSAPPTVIGEFGGAPVWLVTRYEDVRKVLVHPYVSNDFYDAPWWVNKARDPQDATPDEYHHTRTIPLAMEDERHARTRPALVKAMSTRRVEAVGPFLEQTAAELLDGLSEAEPVDLHYQYAVPLGNATLAKVLGIPTDLSMTYPQWSDLLNYHMLDPQAARVAAGKFYGFVASVMSAKRHSLADDGFSDLWRAHDDGVLSEFEIYGAAALLMHAGQEATGVVTNGLACLLRHPRALAEVTSDLSKLAGRIDELLRFESPLRLTLPRHTNGPVELEGATIPPRAYIVVSLAGANHDPAHFANPDALDIDRDAGSHLAFGHGGHRCVGARLGTMVATTGLHALLSRYPAVRLADPDQPIAWRPSTFSRRVATMPVILGRTP